MRDPFPLILGCCLLAAACDAPIDPRRTNFRVGKDGVAAQWDDKSGRLKRIELDQNRNGVFDTWSYMDGARIDRIEIDRDEDGRIDRWEYYVHDKLEKVGSSTRGDGIVDEWAYQGATGSLARVETDTDRDGRIDKWQEFDPPSTPGGVPILRVVAMDPDAKGQPTFRMLYDARGEFERSERGEAPRDRH